MRAWLRHGTTAILAVAVIFGPLAYGGAEVWAYAWLQILAAAAAILWTLSWSTEDRPRGCLGWLPASILVLGLVQIAPVPRSVVATLSPLIRAAQQDCQELVDVAPRSCLSAYPGATWAVAVQGTIFAGVAVLVAHLGRRGATQRGLIAALASIGLVETCLGLWFAGRARWTLFGGLYDMLAPYPLWHYPGSARLRPLNSAGFGGPEWFAVDKIPYATTDWSFSDGFGSYVNSNHFAGCLELTIPFAVALCLGAAAYVRPYWAKGLLMLLSLALAAGSLWTAAYVAGSRTAWGALLLALLIVFWRSCRAVWARRVWGAAAGVYLLLVVGLLVAMFDGLDDLALIPSLSQPMRTVWHNGCKSVQERISLWNLCAVMFHKAPALGVGLGSFGELVPQFVPRDALYVYFAHNDYAQFLAETGIAGILAVLVSGWGIRKFLRPSGVSAAVERTWLERVLDAGASGALGGFGLHIALDWNLHMPANCLLAAVGLGLWLAVHARRPTTQPASSDVHVQPAGRFLWRFGQLGTLLIMSAGAWSAVDELIVEPPSYALREAMTHLYLPGTDRTALLRKIVPLLPAAEVAAYRASWNADYARILGQAHLQLSDGRKSPDLIQAEEWFAAVLERCPIMATVPETLVQIQARLSEVGPVEHARPYSAAPPAPVPAQLEAPQDP